MSRTRLPQPIGIVTGLAVEARLARRLSSMVACTGGVPANVEPAAEGLLASGAKCLMSFGIAGGLAPELQPGALIVASEVITEATRYQVEAALLYGSFPGKATSVVARRDDGKMEPLLRGNADWNLTLGPLYGDIRIASQLSEKNRLYETTGALAVDLESGETARVAAAAGVPFVALRAIADPAWRALPAAALLPLDDRGRPRLMAVLGSVMKKPGQIPGLVMTARDTRAALAALLRACRVLVV